MLDNNEVNDREPKKMKDLAHHNNPQLWAVGGGKGGVGKSFVAANIATQLALEGNKVIVVDLDLGGANIHTCLGCGVPEKSISDFINKREKDLESIMIPTMIKNLHLISGANDSLTVANLKYSQKLKLISSIKKLQADYVIMDLGAGTTFNTLDFYLHAHLGVLVVLPEPTSIENAYRFIKSAFYRLLNMCDTIPGVRELVDQVMENRSMGEVKSPSDLIKKICEIDAELGNTLKERLGTFAPNLILNQVRNESDIDIGFSIKTVCKRYFGVDMNYVGYLNYDHTVWQSVRRKRVLTVDSPNSPLVGNFHDIVIRLTKVCESKNKEASA